MRPGHRHHRNIVAIIIHNIVWDIFQEYLRNILRQLCPHKLYLIPLGHQHHRGHHLMLYTELWILVLEILFKIFKKYYKTTLFPQALSDETQVISTIAVTIIPSWKFSDAEILSKIFWEIFVLTVHWYHHHIQLQN